VGPKLRPLPQLALQRAPSAQPSRTAGGGAEPILAIQELAGHKDLSMTQRYMHVSPAALGAAIRQLEEPAGPSQTGRGLQSFGDLGETAPRIEKNQ